MDGGDSPDLLVIDTHERADVEASYLARCREWRWKQGMVARRWAIVAGPFERKRRPNGGHGPPGVTYVSIPDLLDPGTVGWIASMLRSAVPQYVCLPVFEDGEFRTFAVRDSLGEDSALLSQDPIEGVALSMALRRAWGDEMIAVGG